MMFSRKVAIVSMLGVLMNFAGVDTVDAAKVKQNHPINGLVVSGHNKPVAGVRVHVAHRHKKGVVVANAKVARAKAHHGIVTAVNGTFTMKHHRTGRLTLVAHKKHVGTGHARVTIGKGANASVTIRIHKHHHHHS